MLNLNKQFMQETQAKTVEILNNVMQVSLENIEELTKLNLAIARQYINDTKWADKLASSENSRDFLINLNKVSANSMHDYFANLDSWCKILMHGQSKLTKVFEANVLCTEMSIMEAVDNVTESNLRGSPRHVSRHSSR